MTLQSKYGISSKVRMIREKYFATNIVFRDAPIFNLLTYRHFISYQAKVLILNTCLTCVTTI